MKEDPRRPRVRTVKVESGAYELSNQAVALTIHTPLPADHPFYSLVGRVAAEWALLEHQLDEIIWRLSGTSRSQAACLTSQMMGHFPRFNAIIALLDFYSAHKKIISAVIKESGKVSGLAERRARTVHDAWYVSTTYPDPLQFRAKPRKDLSFGMKPVTEDDLKELIQQIGQRTYEILNLRTEIVGALFP